MTTKKTNKQLLCDVLENQKILLENQEILGNILNNLLNAELHRQETAKGLMGAMEDEGLIGTLFQEMLQANEEKEEDE